VNWPIDVRTVGRVDSSTHLVDADRSRGRPSTRSTGVYVVATQWMMDTFPHNDRGLENDPPPPHRIARLLCYLRICAACLRSNPRRGNTVDLVLTRKDDAKTAKG